MSVVVLEDCGHWPESRWQGGESKNLVSGNLPDIETICGGRLSLGSEFESVRAQ